MTSTTLDLDQLHLESGKHNRRDDGVCVMEAVAWMAGEQHSDMPACVSPALRRFGMRLNDALPDDRRQELKRFIPDLIGTAGDGLDEQRRDLATQWLMRDWLPQWLRLAKLEDLAVKAEASAGLTGSELRTALYAIREVTWQARTERRSALKTEVEKRLREKWAAAAAAAVAVAVATSDKAS